MNAVTDVIENVTFMWCPRERLVQVEVPITVSISHLLHLADHWRSCVSLRVTNMLSAKHDQTPCRVVGRSDSGKTPQ